MTHEQGISRAEQGILGAVAPFRNFGAPQNGVNACEARDLESCSDRRYFAQPREACCGPRDVREFREDRRRGIHRDVSQPRQSRKECGGCTNVPRPLRCVVPRRETLVQPLYSSIRDMRLVPVQDSTA